MCFQLILPKLKFFSRVCEAIAQEDAESKGINILSINKYVYNNNQLMFLFHLARMHLNVVLIIVYMTYTGPKYIAGIVD